MKIFENEIINNESWDFFNKRLAFFVKKKTFINELINTKILYDTFYKIQNVPNDIENLLKKDLKLHLWFYGCEFKKFVNKFEVLPFTTKVLLLKYCESKNYFDFKTSEKDIEFAKQKVEDIKKKIGKEIMSFSYFLDKNSFIPLKTFITLVQYNCFDLTKQSEQLLIEFFAKYLNSEEVKEKLDKSYLYNYYCDLLFSSKTYKDFNDLYNSGNYVKKIDSKTLTFIKKEISEIDGQKNSDDKLEKKDMVNNILVG